MLRAETINVPVGDRFVQADLFIPTVSGEFDPDIRRTTAIIIPGGGYRFICEREAEPVALWFAARGFNAVVAHYSVSPEVYPAPMHDIGAIIKYVRDNAENLHSHPDKIVLVGFSAGGHLAAFMSSQWRDEALWEKIGAVPSDVRPNAAVLCYPVITAGVYAHRDSFAALTGTDDRNVHEDFSAEKLVTSNTCPTFAWCTWTDQAVPAMNTLMYAQALYENGVRAEVHVYPVGLHGLSLSRDFTCYVKQPEKAVPECEEWPEKAITFIKRVTEA